jgi:alpha-glucosidase
MMKKNLPGALLLGLLFAHGCTLESDPPKSGSALDPSPHNAATVTEGDARFTVLTDRLVRMEWSSGGNFEDRASFVFLNRRMPIPQFDTLKKDGWLEIRTSRLTVRYKLGSGKFEDANLEVRYRVGGKPEVWTPGMNDTANLGGTIRTLDGVRGRTDLPPGLLSRSGWTLVDDSERPLFDDSEWPWVVARPEGDLQDYYFFGYGRDYREQLKDFARVAGRIPMPPRFAFGVWWSRYWGYTDNEFKQLVEEFQIHDVPLDVLVIDMDWHLTFDMRWDKKVLDQAGQRLGWTGYTWDRNFFPDPEGFLAWCEDQGLKTPLNLHPASGIQPHELHYPEMARAMGIDPSTKEYVPFDIVDKNFAENYLNLIIRPLERQGVDFWWLDWQQWSTTTIRGVTPTWWLNYVFFTDMERRGGERPLLFHRWGGLGNHRYQIGFSGDAISVWESLAFQPFFTATASNVGFGYWSHDMGGHMPGPISPELYTRWNQFGVFSPILRTHTTKNPAAERRIWAYPVEYFKIMRDAFMLRYALIPYIYTSARQAYDSGVSICRPMYYDFPEEEEAYQHKDQYVFGDDMLVAPITEPISRETMVARKTLWLPEGEWIEWFTGSRLRGPKVVQRYFAIDEIPLYVRAGSIIPMQPKMNRTSERPVDPLILTVFPGDSGTTRIYEDEGNSLGYQRGEYAWTGVRTTVLEDGTWRVEVEPTEGAYPGMITERGYELRLPGVWPPERVTCNGEEMVQSARGAKGGWRYRGEELMIVVSLPRFSRSQRVSVEIEWARHRSGNQGLPDGVAGMVARLKRVMPMINRHWPAEWSPEALIAAVQVGNRMSQRPETAERELQDLATSYPLILENVRASRVPDSTKARVLGHLTQAHK